MKILLTTLNAKYVHTSLALWYLYQYCCGEHPGLKVREFNINQDLNWVCGEIYSENADVLAFSCNIWNIEPILKITRRLKLVAPKITIILGGPEVSAEPLHLMAEHPEIDFIVTGEGEETFKEWLVAYSKAVPDWDGICGLVYRSAERPVQNGNCPPMKDLGRVPFPYPENLKDFRQKMVYYESSRGCPNQCQYCLSANEHGVRFFPLERVKRELLLFIEAEIGQVKFVDRTFNCNPARAREIWRFLMDHPGKTNFHFEIMGELLDDESIELLAEAPEGLFQFEIGVQSTHPETLQTIKRKMDFNSLKTQVQKLVSPGNVFVHLDLIAGLPAEDYRTFSRTFNENIVLNPHRLQLGFLKLLKGSGLRANAAAYDYRFTGEPPYEVMGNRWIDYSELLRLKIIEDLLEKYYNSGRFQRSIRYLFGKYPSAFACFESFADWWKERGLDRVSHKGKDLYGYLAEFFQTVFPDEPMDFTDLLKFDLLSKERMTELPEWAVGGDAEFETDLRRLNYQFWVNEGNRERYIPEWANMTPRDISRRVMFAGFGADPLGSPEVFLGERQKSVVYLFKYSDSQISYFKMDFKNS